MRPDRERMELRIAVSRAADGSCRDGTGQELDVVRRLMPAWRTSRPPVDCVINANRIAWGVGPRAEDGGRTEVGRVLSAAPGRNIQTWCVWIVVASGAGRIAL